MDTVLGCEGSKKVLLTLHFDCCSLMMAYLLDSKEVCHVKAIFDSIERSLGTFFIFLCILFSPDRQRW